MSKPVMAHPEETIFDIIARKRGELSSAELKVADLVLTLPELPLSASMRALARRADVSDATVLRFCRLIGLEGYSEFKLAIARGTSPTRGSLEDGRRPDGDAAIIADLGATAHWQAQAVAGTLVDGRLADIARRVASVGCLDIFAFGTSRVAGWDFANQMMTCGLTAAVISDPHIQAVRTSRMTADSLAVFLSIGFSRLLSDMADAAREKGAYTIAVTTAGTPLSSACASCIDLPADPASNASAPIHARYGQLLVLDALAVRVRENLGRKNAEAREPEIEPKFTF